MEVGSEEEERQTVVVNKSELEEGNIDEISTASSAPIEREQLGRSKSGLHRCKTAPAMDMAAVLREMQAQAAAVAKDEDEDDDDDDDDDDDELMKKWKPADTVNQAAMLLTVYLILGVVVYYLNRDKFSGVETHPVVDALYFSIVTMCTIGYGDITPLTPSTKLFACVFVLVGFGFIDILLSGVLSYVLHLQERALLSDIRHPPNLLLFDLHKGRMRIRLKVALALSVVFLCIAVGSLFLFFFERLSFVDSLYLSALSVTTVGYGDRAFSTLSGRLFASIWLLVSTLAVARAFLYLVEARIDKRHRTLAKWVLQRDITPQDLFAANINNNNFIRKSEYVIYKLKEMGKIGEQDVSLICNQFNKLDPNNMGRITLPDLFQNHQ
ncbi:hypothetical protein RND81_02G000500 [Saponaria officinalis]|uniref:Potassium channel domain-containing protein n=1 Tax=Saponaria officinalis TaxID=3572 RepID=A0AAW1MQW0_SAPOF